MNVIYRILETLLVWVSLKLKTKQKQTKMLPNSNINPWHAIRFHGSTFSFSAPFMSNCDCLGGSTNHDCLSFLRSLHKEKIYLYFKKQTESNDNLQLLHESTGFFNKSKAQYRITEIHFSCILTHFVISPPEEVFPCYSSVIPIYAKN